MSPPTLEQLRLPAALILLVAAVVFFLQLGDDGRQPDPSPSVVAGDPAGAVTSTAASPQPTASPAPTPLPTLTLAPTVAPTPSPQPATPQPTPAPDPGNFAAEVLVCRSISGSTCQDRLRNVGPKVSSVVALVRFTDANAGDRINAIVSGPSGTFEGGAYALQGGGDGYYYSTFSTGGLAPGEYTVTATRNGEPVATTRFNRRGG